jgi:hypothetical protein
MHLGVEGLFAKGMGDLPDSPQFKYLRPFALQAELGYAATIQGPSNSDTFANLQIEYSFQYLDRFVEPIGVCQTILHVVPLSSVQLFPGLYRFRRLTTSPDFRLTPGLAYLGDTFEVSVGSQVALNGAYEKGDRVAFLGLMEIFYDELFPALGWKPFNPEAKRRRSANVLKTVSVSSLTKIRDANDRAVTLNRQKGALSVA